MSKILSVAEARNHKGVRLVLTASAPGPWGEAIKGMLHVKQIPFDRVRQNAGTTDPELVEWTGIRNAPQVIDEDDKPLHAWADLIQFVERRAKSPALIPEDPELRVQMFGLIHELAGDDGLAWNRRLLLFKPVMDLLKDGPNPAFDTVVALASHYRYSEEAATRASGKSAEVLRLFGARLQAQQSSGSRYLVGDQLSALDIYWAAFCALVKPLPEELCPMPEYLRQSYGNVDETVMAALDPALVAHRDYIYENYLELPVELV